MAPSLTLLGPILAAVVTYVAPDGVYLDEGADDGVKVGDEVVIGKQLLVIQSVAPGRSRTEPPGDPFALRVGAPAQINRTGAPREDVEVAPRKPAPPGVTPDLALRWWPDAKDGWVEPRPLPESGSTRPEADDDGRIWGTLGLDGHVIAQDQTTWRFGARSTLAAEGEAFWYRHDLRFNLDRHGGRWPEPPVEVRRLEAGWRDGLVGVRAGRMVLADPLAAASLDGAAVGLHDVGIDRVRVFAGVAPDTLELRPEVKNPQVGVSADSQFTLDAAGEYTGRFDVTGLVSGFDGGLDRLAVAPAVSVRGGPLRAQVRSEFDAYAGSAPEGRGPVELTRIYGSLGVDITDWLDAQVRYDRYRAPALASLAAVGIPIQGTARQSVTGDVRFDGGAFGVARVSTTLRDGPDGYVLVPGLDYWIAVSDRVDLSAAMFYRDGVYERITHGRLGAALRLDAPWPMSFDVGARVTDVVLLDRDELSGTEVTGEVGLWMATPGGFDLRVSAERGASLAVGDAALPVTLVFADLRWRFGR